MIQWCQSWMSIMCGIGEKMTILLYKRYNVVNHGWNIITTVQMIQWCQWWTLIMCWIGERNIITIVQTYNGINLEGNICIVLLNGIMVSIFMEISQLLCKWYNGVNLKCQLCVRLVKEIRLLSFKWYNDGSRECK